MQSRSIIDAALIVTKAFPAANTLNMSPTIDLGTAAPGISLEKVELQVSAPPTPNLADATTITYTVLDSDDDVGFAAVQGLAGIVSTGAGGAGAPALERKIKLPPTVRRYVRVQAAVLAAGGDNTGLSYSAALLF